MFDLVVLDETPSQYATESLPICLDFDKDCEAVVCNVTCWRHDPTKGLCPLINKEEFSNAIHGRP